MRIVVVSAWEPWRTADGAAFVLDHQLRELSGRHDITLLTAGAPTATALPPPELARRLPGVGVRWFGAARTPGLDHLARRVWSVRHREPAHVAFVERPGLRVALDDALAAGVDVVHLHGWGTARLWQRAGGTPTVHMAIDPWSVNAGNRRLPFARRLVEQEQRRAIAAHERRHYPRLGAVIVVTPSDAQALQRIAPGARIEVIANGVTAGAEPAPIGGRPVIGFHGVFDSQANVDAARSLVEDVLPRVRRRVPDAQALVVGRRPPRSVTSLAGNGVQILADVPEIRTELERMTVHVDWMSSGAGLKNKVLEAMAAGRPVVASELGAQGVGEGPGLVVATDVDAAAAAVVAWLSDLPAAVAQGAAGRARVLADFSWPTSAGRLEALWSDVAQGSRR